jgi:hypothetical protein
MMPDIPDASLEFKIVSPVYRFCDGGRWAVTFDVQWKNLSQTEPADIGPAYDGDVITVRQGVADIPESGTLIGALLGADQTLERRLLYVQFVPREEPAVVTIEYSRKSQVHFVLETQTVLLSQEGLVVTVEPQGKTRFQMGPHPFGRQDLIEYQVHVNNPHDEPHLFDPYSMQCAWGNQRRGYFSSNWFNAMTRVEPHEELCGSIASYYDPWQELPQHVQVFYRGQAVGEFEVIPEPDQP